MSNPHTPISLKEFCSKVDKARYLKLGQELSTKNVGKSFSLLSFGLSLSSRKREEYYKLYLKVLECWSNKLIESSRYQDVLKIFEVAQDIYSQSPDIDYLLACTLYRIGKLREAWQYSVKVLNTCKNDPKARDLASSLTNSLIDRWNFPMINDYQRNKKYKEAIRKCIQRGCTPVLDIGAGSALLSIYALQSGSRETYACEVDEFMTEMATNVLTLNSAQERIVLLNKHSKDLQIPSDLPSRVSLIVTETFDAGLFGEHILHILKHAWNHLLLSPFHSSISEVDQKQTENVIGTSVTRVLPSHAEIWVAIMECDYVARQIKLIRNVEMFKDVSVKLRLKEPYLSEKINNIPGKYKLLTKWEKVLDVDFNSLTNIDDLLSGKEDKQFQFHITTDGRGDGLLLSYKLFLDADNCIDTFPESGTCWENAIYPIFNSSRLTKMSWVTVNLECDGVLHFTILDLPQSPFIATTDTQFMKSLNSSSYIGFYRGTSESFYAQNSSASLVVLDNCPFPQGGITLLELNPNTRLFVGSENAFTILTHYQIKVKRSEALKGHVDIIFYWPFSSEGTLKDNILEELQSYRNLLTKKGKIYPEFLDLQMLGLQSDLITKMTRIEDNNTCGVEVAEVFNLLKTEHHLDVAIEGISYNPLTPILNPIKLSLNDCKITHIGKELNEDNPREFLIVGGELSRSSLSIQSVGDGRIDGFVYWFELSNSKTLPEQETSSESDYDGGCKSTTFEMKSLRQELNLKPKLHRQERDYLTFNSFSRDSPINQCVLLLDEPFVVSRDQSLDLQFAMSEEHFSIVVNGHDV